MVREVKCPECGRDFEIDGRANYGYCPCGIEVEVRRPVRKVRRHYKRPEV